MDENSSGIIEQCLEIKKMNMKDASHFAVYKRDNIKYLVSLTNKGKVILSNNIATYSLKHFLMKILLRFIPFRILKGVGLGDFVSVHLHEGVSKIIQRNNKHYWNVIFGTYDEKQKLVIQAYDDSELLPIYIKVGNDATNAEMRSEMQFLEQKNIFATFKVPELIETSYLNTDCPFNIQVTKEFSGKKMSLELTQDIVDIYYETSSINSVGKYEFSHGDFAPWNLKKNKKGYVVYDWEHCGMRIKGFDILHYVVMPKILLKKMTVIDSVKEGIKEIQNYIPGFEVNEEKFIDELKKLHFV